MNKDLNEIIDYRKETKYILLNKIITLFNRDNIVIKGPMILLIL